MQRIVVTGLGCVSPLGCGVERVWRRLIEGRSGLRRLPDEDAHDLPVKVAALVPALAEDVEGGFDPEASIAAKDLKKMDRFIQFAMVAADEALAAAGWAPADARQRERTATIVASGVGGFPAMAEATRVVEAKGPRRLSPFTIPSFLANLAAGQISIKHGLRGPLGCPVTACAASVQAIGDAMRLIRAREADVVLAGGAEACVDRVSLAGFAAARTLSTGFAATPEKASRPFDRDRDGFVMGEGAGAVVLEEYEHAKRRGARIYGELVGYGLSGDAFHITAPADDGDGALRCMKAAIRRAEISPGDLDYINAHGTSTPLGDEIELKAVEKLVGNSACNISMSSTKSSIGHLLGAAGTVEAIFCLLAIRDQVVPPTINLDNPSVATALDLVPHKPRERAVNVVLSNSFGFGGTNASLVFRRLPD